MFYGDFVEAGEDAAAQAAAAVEGRHVHALHLGDVGVEVADAAEPGRFAVNERKEEDAVRRNQVGWRPFGDLLVEVDPGPLAVVDQRPVGLANEVGVKRLNPRIVAVDRVKGEIHRNDANALRNFSNLRATRTVTPGTIVLVTQQEMEASIRVSVARAEAARAGVEVAREGIEVARRKQEESVARQEANMEKLEKRWAEADARWEEERVTMRVHREESARKTDAIIAELKEHRDERRALLEAIFRVIDRLDQQQPPPPNLRSV